MKRSFIFLLAIIMVSGGIALSQEDRKTDSLEKLLKSGKLPSDKKAKVFYQLARCYLYSNENLCYAYADSAILLAVKVNNPKAEAESYSLQGVVHKNRGEFEKAITKHLTALGIKEKNQDTMGVAICYNDIGVLYKVMKNYSKALYYYRRSNELCRSINLGKGIAQTYNNLGTIYSEQGNGDSALFYYKKALAKAEEINNSAAISTACSNIGEYYGNRNDNATALKYFKRCLALDEANGDLYGMMMSYINIGGAFTQQKKFGEALIYYKLAEKLCIENGEKPMLKNLYNSLSVCYANSNDKAKAYDYLLKHIALRDSIEAGEIQKNIVEMETKYQSAKKDLEIEKHKAELEASRKALFIRNIIIVSVVCIVLLVSLALYQLFRKRQIRQQAELDAELAKQRELRSKAVIEAEEKERIRIAKDLHDGVGQILSAAKMNLDSLQHMIKIEGVEEESAFKNTVSLIDESVREVRAVSHSMMPNTLLKMGLVSAIKEFVTKLQSTPNLKVNLEIVGMEGRIEQEKESVLYRVIQEVISNIIKHAGASTLVLQMVRHEHELNIMIEDNGKGFDVSRIDDFEGIGLKNIMSRVEFINGLVHFDSAPGKGTRVIIDVPV
jgi:signal transduction histidine kinase